jgi:endonuclease YncB( thermonuclease family)
LLIKSGLAIVSYIDLNKKSPFYTSDFKYYKTLLNLQYKAYNENVGIWKHKNSIKDIFTN